MENNILIEKEYNCKMASIIKSINNLNISNVDEIDAYWYNDKYLATHSHGMHYNEYIFEYHSDNKFSLVYSSMTTLYEKIDDDSIIVYNNQIKNYDELKKYACKELKVIIYDLDKKEFIDNWKKYSKENYTFEVIDEIIYFTLDELCEFLLIKLNN